MKPLTFLTLVKALEKRDKILPGYAIETIVFDHRLGLMTVAYGALLDDPPREGRRFHLAALVRLDSEGNEVDPVGLSWAGRLRGKGLVPCSSAFRRLEGPTNVQDVPESPTGAYAMSWGHVLLGMTGYEDGCTTYDVVADRDDPARWCYCRKTD